MKRMEPRRTAHRLARIMIGGAVGLLAAAVVFAADQPNGEEVELAVPRLLSWAPPEWPRETAGQKAGGWVRLRCVIDETGAVSRARALGSTNPVLAAAAVQSVLQWRFAPAESGGRKVTKSVDLVLPVCRTDRASPSVESRPPAAIQQSLEYSPYTAPKRLTGADPDYPDSLLSRQLRGEVDLEFTVDAQGRERAPKILWATHADFIRPALDAVIKWTFQPASQGDLVVPATLKALVEFEVIDKQRADALTANGITLRDPMGEAFDAEPRPWILTDPVYPYDLRLAGTEGDAAVDFVIGARGIPESVIVRTATRPEFGAALAAALECWRFQPAGKLGLSVPVKASARWHFSLDHDAPAFQATERLVQRLRRNDTADMGARGLDGPLRPVYQIPPCYPGALLADERTGEAEIAFIIDREGRCRLARIVSGSRPEFGWAAATAIERWVFDPPTRGGQPADVRVTIPVEFSPPP